MTTATVSLFEFAAEWRTARRLYPFYSFLIDEFQLNHPHCKDLENPVDRADREVLERIQTWFAGVDRQVQVAQVRQLLQNQRFGEEELLRALLLRHLPQEQLDDNLRDKLDYLLVQYFAAVAPHHPHDDEVTSAEVQQALRPVLGHVDASTFSWSEELNNIAEAVDRCSSLAELLDSGLVELGRKLKRDLGDGYFEPAALIEITRFNFRLRLGFFRLMHTDLHSIRKALQELEAMGIGTVDCREAGLGAKEPLATLRNLCHQWKKPFREAYRAGQSFRQLGTIRSVLQHAVMSQWTAKAAKGPGSAMASEAELPVGFPSAPAEVVHGPICSDTLEQVIESISEQLFAAKQKSTVSAVLVGGSRQILSSWEVTAFVRGGDRCCTAIQKAVAARCLLAESAQKVRAGQANGFAQALECAHGQACAIQEQVARAKDRADIDSAVNLAATAKRLLTLIDETEKLKA
jgi:hypothetical protein